MIYSILREENSGIKEFFEVQNRWFAVNHRILNSVHGNAFVGSFERFKIFSAGFIDVPYIFGHYIICTNLGNITAQSI